MEQLTLILALSTVIWYCVDKFKPLWSHLSFAKYITIGCAAVLGFAAVFSFGLDLFLACGLVFQPSIMGEILTGLVLMSGSSAVSEIIDKIKGETKIITEERDQNSDEQ